MKKRGDISLQADILRPFTQPISLDTIYQFTDTPQHEPTQRSRAHRRHWFRRTPYCGWSWRTEGVLGQRARVLRFPGPSKRHALAACRRHGAEEEHPSHHRSRRAAKAHRALFIGRTGRRGLAGHGGCVGEGKVHSGENGQVGSRHGDYHSWQRPLLSTFL